MNIGMTLSGILSIENSESAVYKARSEKRLFECQRIDRLYRLEFTYEGDSDSQFAFLDSDERCKGDRGDPRECMRSSADGLSTSVWLLSLHHRGKKPEQ